MPDDRIEPLSADLWFESLEWLKNRSKVRKRLTNRLRFSYHLAALAPPPLSSVVHCPWDEAAFEELLQSAAYETAAIALLGTVLSFEAVRDPGGTQVAARVWLTDFPGEGRCTSESFAAAVHGAWFEFLFTLKGKNAG